MPKGQTILARFGRLLRDQSRRLLVAGTLAFVSGSLLFAHLPGQLSGLRASIFIGFFYGLMVVLGVLITTSIFPRQRRFIDAVAVSRLVFALYVVAVPEIGQPIATSPFYSATIVVGSAFLLLAACPVLHARCCREEMPIAIRWCAKSVRDSLIWIDRAER